MFATKANQRPFTGAPPMGLFMRFLLNCAGVHVEFFLRQDCAIERRKYAGLGMTVLNTAASAVLSGSYAAFTVIDGNSPGRPESQLLAIAFGLFWGWLVF